MERSVNMPIVVVRELIRVVEDRYNDLADGMDLGLYAPEAERDLDDLAALLADLSLFMEGT